MPTQQQIPLPVFARALRETGEGFDRRVKSFESRFGLVDDETLAVLAQAAYFCWFEQEYERDFVGVCRAIGSGRANSLYLCGQVSPQRWIVLNSYVIGIQQWLGVDCPLPTRVDAARVQRVIGWLGQPTPAKRALSALFLHDEIHTLHGLTRCAILGKPEEQEETEYPDYREWYEVADSDIEQVRALLAAENAEADELLVNLFKESQPPCMHRYTRYLDIRITSIGALKWRGAVPPDTDVPQKQAAQYLDAATASVEAWLTGAPPDGELAQTLYAALGESTPRKQAMVREFFLPCKDDLSDGFFEWVVNASKSVPTAPIAQ